MCVSKPEILYPRKAHSLQAPQQVPHQEEQQEGQEEDERGQQLRGV